MILEWLKKIDLKTSLILIIFIVFVIFSSIATVKSGEIDLLLGNYEYIEVEEIIPLQSFSDNEYVLLKYHEGYHSNVYIFYLLNEKGTKILKSTFAENTQLVDCDVDQPYVKVVWRIKKNKTKEIYYDYFGRKNRFSNLLIEISDYADKGSVKDFTIYSSVKNDL